MPRDIFADSSVTSQQPRDIFADTPAPNSGNMGFTGIAKDALSGAAQLPSSIWGAIKSAPQAARDISNMSGGDIFKNLAAGLASSVTGAVNLPYSLDRYLGQKGIIGKDFYKNVPHIPENNYSQQLNIKPSAGSSLLQGLGQVPLYMAAPEGSALSKIGAQSIVGASQSDNPAQGAVSGAALGGVESIPNLKRAISPEESMKDVYKTVADSLDKEKAKSEDAYNYIMSSYGNNKISIKGLDSDVLKKNSAIKSQYNNFVKSPTIQNAHKLQSQLGSTERAITAKDVDSSDRKAAYRENREIIQKAIEDQFNKLSPHASSLYKEASEHYKNEVIPREITNDAIQGIVQPTPEKVAKKIEEVTKRKIYPKTKINQIYVPAVPEEISKAHANLHKTIRNKQLAQIGAGAALGGTLSHSLGLPLLEAVTAGGALTPYLLKKYGIKSSNKFDASKLADILSKASKAGARATTATAITSRGNQ